MEAPLPASNGTVPIHDATRQTVPDMAQTQGMSAAEIALYDRQIRLWGVQAQEKIRTANILIVSIKALANEVAKNLVLAGIGSLTLVDSETVTEDDLCSQFFISEADVGKNVRRYRTLSHELY
jgi:ubiquitin-like 1-activating enzyme E1 A